MPTKSRSPAMPSLRPQKNQRYCEAIFLAQLFFLQAWDGWLAAQRDSWLSPFSTSRVDLLQDLTDEDEDTDNGDCLFAGSA